VKSPPDQQLAETGRRVAVGEARHAYASTKPDALFALRISMSCLPNTALARLLIALRAGGGAIGLAGMWMVLSA